MAIQSITEVELKKSEFDLIPTANNFTNEKTQISELVLGKVVFPEVETFIRKVKNAGFYGVSRRSLNLYIDDFNARLRRFPQNEPSNLRANIINLLLNAANTEIPGFWDFRSHTEFGNQVETRTLDQILVSTDGGLFQNRYFFTIPIHGKKIKFKPETIAAFNTSLSSGKKPIFSENILENLKEITTICKYLRILNIKAIRNKIPLYLKGSMSQNQRFNKTGILTEVPTYDFVIDVSLIYPIGSGSLFHSLKVKDIEQIVSETTITFFSKELFEGRFPTASLTLLYKTLETYVPLQNPEKVEDFTWSPLITLLFLEDFKTILTTIFRRFSTNETRLFD